MLDADMDGAEEAIVAPTIEVGAFSGEIPTGLFGNEGGTGLDGGPLVAAKLFPKIIMNYIYLFNQLFD